MCLKIDKTLIGMGLTTGDVPTPRVSALMWLKTQKFPQMSVHTSAHTHTHSCKNIRGRPHLSDVPLGD